MSNAEINQSLNNLHFKPKQRFDVSNGQLLFSLHLCIEFCFGVFYIIQIPIFGSENRFNSRTVFTMAPTVQIPEFASIGKFSSRTAEAGPAGRSDTILYRHLQIQPQGRLHDGGYHSDTILYRHYRRA